MTESHNTRRTRRGQIVGLLAGTLVAGLATFQVSGAAFTATTDDGSNTFQAASISLVDDDTTQVMFALTDLVPGDSEVNCINVEYTGGTFDVTAISLYAGEDANVDNFADHLDVTIEMGTGGSFGDCTGFTNESTLTTATALSALTTTNTDFASGLTAFTPVVGTVDKTFRFTVALGNDTPDSAQGDSAAATFTWEIQTN